jgi:hypothetical protein
MEMKTNDVTGRYKKGEVGFTVDIGRPGIGTTFSDVEKIAAALADAGVQFDPLNPVTRLMSDVSKGKFKPEVLKERVLSCILEFKVEEKNLMPMIRLLKDTAEGIDTVVSVGCICRCLPEGSAPLKDILEKADIFFRPNGKINIGLGRPLAG